jgi:hypothetical protein
MATTSTEEQQHAEEEEEEKLAIWIDEQKSAYALGHLERWKVEELESRFSGWCWKIEDKLELEKLSIRLALDLLSDEEEASLRKNVDYYTWMSFEQYLDLAKEYRATLPENAVRPPYATVVSYI